MAEYTFKAGTTKPLRVTLVRSDGSPVSLEGSQVDFHMEGAVLGLGLPEVTGAATILEGTVDPDSSTGSLFAKGTVEYPWASDETLVPGLYRAVWRITDAANDFEVVPNEGWFSLVIEYGGPI